MKNLFITASFLFFGYANAQQILPNSQTQQQTVLISPSLQQAIIDWDQQLSDVNADLLYYSKNYNKVFNTGNNLYNKDSADKFADFYEAYNYSFNDNVLKTPIIKGMPAPGPHLDYWSVCPNSGGNFDKVIGN